MSKGNDLLEGLNEPQKQGVLNTEGAVLLLAGAGSGKTMVITRKIAYLIYELSVPPESIMAVTFTNKAASEMKGRVCAAVPELMPYRLWVRTFHASGLRILKQDAHLLNYKNDFNVVDAQDSLAMIKKVIKDNNISLRSYLTPKTISKSISEAKDNMMDPRQYAEYCSRFDNPTSNTIAKVYELYAKFLKNENAMDFDDLIYNTVLLFEQNPAVLRYYRDLWKYILVDEFQDTNSSQYRLVRMLCQGGGNVTAVGDDDQSIYSFRGAVVENILNFPNDFEDTKIIRLEQNYRCPSNVVSLALSLIENNKKRHEKYVFSDKGDEYPIELWECASDDSEAAYITGEVERLFDEGFDAKDVAVLYRTNAQSRLFEKTMLAHSIPYKVVGGLRFFERAEVKDALAYLRLCVNKGDNISFRRVFNKPSRGIGEKSFAALESFAGDRGTSLFDAISGLESIKMSKKAASALVSFKSYIERYTKAVNEARDEDDYVKVIEDILTGMDYYERQYKEDWRRIEAKENIAQLCQSVKEYIPGTGLGGLEGLKSFLEEVQLLTDAQTNEDDDAVTLMTVHNAKGLEYPVVFLSGLENGVFPHYFSLKDENGIEEERRLCYVAVTRAKRKLYISYAKMRVTNREGMYSRPSFFIDELPREGLVFKQPDNMGGNAIDIDEDAFSY